MLVLFLLRHRGVSKLRDTPTALHAEHLAIRNMSSWNRFTDLFEPGSTTLMQTALQKTSVLDPGNFGTDPDPRIRTTNLRIRILLFSSVADKMPQKSFFCLLLFEGTFTPVFQGKN
jgi:hypothetical protein